MNETPDPSRQPTDDELSTLNDVLQIRDREVTQTNCDFLNLSLVTDAAVLMLDKGRRVRRFTPRAGSLLKLLPSHVGRSIGEIDLGIAIPDLDQQIGEVMAGSAVKESELQDGTGRWFRVQIRPYTTPEQTVGGAIVALVDIHEGRQLVAEAQRARAEATRANLAKEEFLATLSHELRTPLSTMLLNAQRLRTGDVLDRAEMQRAGEWLERAAAMQVKLIDDLLDVTRIVGDKRHERAGPSHAPAPPLAQVLDRPGMTQHYRALVNLRVLFVDDDLRTREAVAEVLELCGAHVELAASAAEAAAAIDAFDPQVILCDIAMPEEDGYTFMRKLRARKSGHGPSIPALALTALSADSDRRRALSAGFQLHLTKPIDIDRLRDAVLTLSKLPGSPSA